MPKKLKNKIRYLRIHTFTSTLKPSNNSMKEDGQKSMHASQMKMM